MPTKQKAVDFAKEFQWTAKDAERAFANLDLQNADKKALLQALVAFAGPELAERQRLQGAQKAQVTKKTKYIKEVETKFSEKIKEYEEVLKQERSTFVDLINGIYSLARRLGFKDPWIETLLSQYEDYQSSSADQDSQQQSISSGKTSENKKQA